MSLDTDSWKCDSLITTSERGFHDGDVLGAFFFWSLSFFFVYQILRMQLRHSFRKKVNEPLRNIFLKT